MTRPATSSNGNGNGNGRHATGPDVVLGMPGYGEVTGGASMGFWRATRRTDAEVMRIYQEGSLLAANFNALWCTALNLAHRGTPPRYFAMQHADVEPEPYWLDALIDELEAHDLDILGVVVPIKDRKGVTSIALDRPPGDVWGDWKALARLTMDEVYHLPETFTSEDVGHPILLNTGLWVCRFDLAWARLVHFEINDRIYFDKPRDCYVAQCEPEDWFFSRCLHELGKRIGCTRKVRLTHRGPMQFTNALPWGQSHDSAYVDRTVLAPPAVPADFTLPDIDGWLRPAEGAKLAELAEGKRVLEVGSYLGLSTVCLARTAEFVSTIDPGDGRATPCPQPTSEALRCNLARHGVDEKVWQGEGTLAQFAPILSDLRFDLIFIDADHSHAAVRDDLARALPLLAPGGLIAFHDYASAADPGVKLAVDEFLLAAGAALVSLTDSLAVVRPPASLLRTTPDPQPEPATMEA